MSGNLLIFDMKKYSHMLQQHNLKNKQHVCNVNLNRRKYEIVNKTES